MKVGLGAGNGRGGILLVLVEAVPENIVFGDKGMLLEGWGGGWGCVCVNGITRHS